MRKKVFSLLFCAAVCFGTMGAVNASTWTEGVTFVNIPGGGNQKVNLSKGNKKTSTDIYASFVPTKLTALLGNSARLITKSQNLASDWVALSSGKVNYALERGCKKGTTYYSAVKSNTIEWGNNNDVTMDFSADKK